MKRHFKLKISDLEGFELLTDELAYKITGGVQTTSEIVAGHMYRTEVHFGHLYTTNSVPTPAILVKGAL